jgi:aspartate/methionine/tyrosine aminotransferase
MTLADRIGNLGTEKAFAVADEALALVKAGATLYPFHIGDINLPTPESIVRAAERAIRDGKTGYCSNYGLAELRELLAEDVNAARGTAYAADNVAVQPGGKPVIGKFLLALMNPGDEVLFPNPGFPIYESLIGFYGGRPVPYGYLEGERNFAIDIERMKRSLTPRTRLLILNDLHNPTGAEASLQELEEIAELAERHDLAVLCDEAYFDLRYQGRSRSLTSLPGMSDRCVILFTFSKRFAMTGWRLGAALGPRGVIDTMARLNVNDESCTNHFVQWAGVEALRGPQDGRQSMIRILKERRDRAAEVLDSIRGVRCYRPNATFYLYPNVTEAMRAKGFSDYEAFRRAVLEDTGVSFCTRLHFGARLPGETDFYIRIAYGGIDADGIVRGLSRLKEYLES